MKVQIVSDIHTEFHPDKGVAFVETLAPEGVQVLVVAGDLGYVNWIKALFQRLCAKYPYVVAVCGNHEFYNSNRPEVLRVMEECRREFPNLHILEDNAVEIEGQRFIGSTLWFPDDPLAAVHRHRFNDFKFIEGFRDWVYAVNRKSHYFLRHNVQPGDVVVTHHVPTIAGISSYRRSDVLNPFYVCDMMETIWACQPRLWAYGHTHSSFRFWKGDTELVCNPFGYLGKEENPEFQFDLCIDL